MIVLGISEVIRILFLDVVGLSIGVRVLEGLVMFFRIRNVYICSLVIFFLFYLFLGNIYVYRERVIVVVFVIVEI